MSVSIGRHSVLFSLSNSSLHLFHFLTSLLSRTRLEERGGPVLGGSKLCFSHEQLGSHLGMVAVGHRLSSRITPRGRKFKKATSTRPLSLTKVARQLCRGNRPVQIHVSVRLLHFIVERRNLTLVHRIFSNRQLSSEFERSDFANDHRFPRLSSTE